MVAAGCVDGREEVAAGCGWVLGGGGKAWVGEEVAAGRVRNGVRAAGRCIMI